VEAELQRSVDAWKAEHPSPTTPHDLDEQVMMMMMIVVVMMMMMMMMMMTTMVMTLSMVSICAGRPRGPRGAARRHARLLRRPRTAL
jgi:hypothetical protein